MLKLVTGTEQAPSTEMPTHRAYLTEAEVEQLVKAAGNHRDATMILLAYRHGLRVSELVNLSWAQLKLREGRIDIARLKGGEDGVHPISGREMRALKRIQREQVVGSKFVFMTSRGAPMTREGFRVMLSKAANRAGLDGVHPHLLRHATGYKLVNQGMDSLSLAAYLGHRNINNTKRYARMAANRFEGIWRD